MESRLRTDTIYLGHPFASPQDETELNLNWGG